MKDEFSQLHPLSQILYLACVTAVIIFVPDPGLEAFGAVLGFIYYVLLMGRRAVKNILIYIPLGLIAAVVNPLFSHQGATILGYFPDGNPVTLESILYGLGMGLLLITMLIWLSILNKIYTSDRWIYIFSSIAPSLGLMFSMILRFVPKFSRRQKETAQVNSSAGAVKRFSMMLTWSLESSVDTADSMAARGYGSGPRRSLNLFRWKLPDTVLAAFTILFTALILYLRISGSVVWTFYPFAKRSGDRAPQFIYMAAFACLAAIPCISRIKEKITWHIWRSKI